MTLSNLDIVANIRLLVVTPVLDYHDIYSIVETIQHNAKQMCILMPLIVGYNDNDAFIPRCSGKYVFYLKQHSVLRLI